MKLINILLAFFVGVFVLLSIGSDAWAQDDSEPTQQERLVNLMAVAILEGVESVIQVENQLVIEEQVEFFGLDDSATAKLNVLSKNLLQQHLTRFDEDRQKEAARTAIQGIGIGNSLWVNGKLYTLEGEDEEEPFVRVTVSNHNNAFYLRASSSRQTLSMQIFRSQGDSELAGYEKFKTVVAAGNGKSVEDYQNHVKQRARDAVLEFMVSIAGNALKVSLEQEEALRAWFAEQLQVKVGQTIFRNAKNNLTEISKLPDFLSDTQKEGWRLMIAELKLR